MLRHQWRARKLWQDRLTSGPTGRQKRNNAMNANVFRFLAPGILTSAALVLAGSAGAQTSTRPAPSDAAVKQNVDMKADCQTMIAKKQEMEDKMKAMDATLDKLVADMNAAAGSKAIGAMKKAASIPEPKVGEQQPKM